MNRIESSFKSQALLKIRSTYTDQAGTTNVTEKVFISIQIIKEREPMFLSVDTCYDCPKIPLCFEPYMLNILSLPESVRGSACSNGLGGNRFKHQG